MAAKLSKQFAVAKQVLAALFQTVGQQFNADAWFLAHAKRILMKMAVQIGREGEIRYSTVLKYAAELCEVSGQDPVIFAIQMFKYLEAESEEWGLKLVYDGGQAEDKTENSPVAPARMARDAMLAKINTVFGDENAARREIRKQLQREVKIEPRGAQARTVRWIGEQAEVAVSVTNARLLLRHFVDDADIDAIIGNAGDSTAEPTAPDGRRSAFASRLIDKLGGEAKAKKAVERAIIAAAKDGGKRGASKRAVIEVAREHGHRGAMNLSDFQVRNLVGKILGIDAEALLADEE